MDRRGFIGSLAALAAAAKRRRKDCEEIEIDEDSGSSLRWLEFRVKRSLTINLDLDDVDLVRIEVEDDQSADLEFYVLPDGDSESEMLKHCRFAFETFAEFRSIFHVSPAPMKDKISIVAFDRENMRQVHIPITVRFLKTSFMIGTTPVCMRT